MNICMIGDFSENLDEGYKNTSHYLARGLEQQHTVVRLNAKQVGSKAFWQRFAAAEPQIIHTIAQPTDQALLLTHLLRQMRPQARTVVSALRGESYFAEGKVGLKQRMLLRAARPDLMLVQSQTAEALFHEAGVPVAHLPNGVDFERFSPAGTAEKQALRRKYGVPLNRPVVLHVGHLHAQRNLEALAPLPERNIQVVVAGSLYMGTHHDLIAHLERVGFQLFKGYQPHVEELYKLADCYVFPTTPGNSITMPLSVLEAMACNLPVITTRFIGLEQAFTPGRGFWFLDDAARLPAHVEAALHLSAGNGCYTREMVQRLSWQAVTEQLETLLEGLVAA